MALPWCGAGRLAPAALIRLGKASSSHLPVVFSLAVSFRASVLSLHQPCVQAPWLNGVCASLGLPLRLCICIFRDNIEMGGSQKLLHVSKVRIQQIYACSIITAIFCFMLQEQAWRICKMFLPSRWIMGHRAVLWLRFSR